MSRLTEAVLLGCGDARLADLHLSDESATLLDLALGSSREPASSLWRKMKEYAVSRGEGPTHRIVFGKQSKNDGRGVGIGSVGFIYFLSFSVYV